MPPISEGIYLVLTFCMFCMSLVLDNSDLDDSPIHNTNGLHDISEIRLSLDESNLEGINQSSINNGVPILQAKNTLGAQIFALFAHFYFISELYIVFAILYILISVGFSSSISYFLIVIVPSTCCLSLIMHNPRDIKQYVMYLPVYFYYIPTYINILQIYSICKTDDVSWGTCKEGESDLSITTQKFKYKKVLYLIIYVLTNSIFGFLFQR